jgi:hypothetical protein
MPSIREIIATLIAAAALAALALVVTGQPSPQAVTVRLSASQKAHPACDWRIVHRLDRYTTWQYVTPDLARYEHIGRCSKVFAGTGQSVITGQDGHVADVS